MCGDELRVAEVDHAPVDVVDLLRVRVRVRARVRVRVRVREPNLADLGLRHVVGLLAERVAVADGAAHLELTRGEHLVRGQG